MQTFSTLTLFFALSTAVPHALNHFRLHERALQADALALKPLVERDRTVKTHLVERQEGACTDSSTCPQGMCCSQYGFCGVGPQYCGGSSANSFGPPSGQQGPPGSYPHPGPPGGFGPPPGSPQGPPQGPPSGQPPSPSGAAPIPSGAPPSQPSAFPSQPSGAPSQPSGIPSAPSQPPSPSGAAPAPSGSAPSQPSGFPSQPSGAPSQPSSPPTAPSGAPAPSVPAQPSGSAAPAPAPSSAPGGGSGGGLGNVYKFYTGDGSPTAGWPAQSAWADFESLWSANLPTISISCTQFGEKNNSPQESDEMKAAIQSVGASEGIDPRVILAVVMQESKGCVRVITTDNGVINPGLMQSHDGTGTCNSGGDGAPGMDPCPSTQITQMIHDGSVGTASGAGLKEVLPQCTATDIAQKYYQAATIYNSGNLPQNLDDNTATACYASDIANRLTGWTTAQTQCNL